MLSYESIVIGYCFLKAWGGAMESKDVDDIVLGSISANAEGER